MSIISLSLPEPLLERLDLWAKEVGFTSRSDAIRASLRASLIDYESAKNLKGKAEATITVSYDGENEQKIADAKHEFNDIIISTIHAHTKDDNRCIDVMVVEGKVERVKGLADRLSATKYIRIVKTVLL
ncbi:MAG: CopG family ribbon-helix-helix protein [Nitrososphaerales archaeon]